jgi:hypothetical protein
LRCFLVEMVKMKDFTTVLHERPVY